jgi:hypothetical protein
MAGSVVEREEVEFVARVLADVFIRSPAGGWPMCQPVHEGAFGVHGAGTAAAYGVTVEEPGATDRAAEPTGVRQLVESRAGYTRAPTAGAQQQSVGRPDHQLR